MDQFNYSNNNNNNNNNIIDSNINDESLANNNTISGHQSAAATIEEITSDLNRMDVNMMEGVRTFDNQNSPLTQNLSENLTTTTVAGHTQDKGYPCHADYCLLNAGPTTAKTQDYSGGDDNDLVMMATEDADHSGQQMFGHETQPYISLEQQQQQQYLTSNDVNQGNNNNDECSDILIVTNVDSSVFQDNLVRAKFEALFLAYDPNVTFRYLKSFRRVRLDFNNSHMAAMARNDLNGITIGNTSFRCYSAQIIKPNNNINNNNIDNNQNDAPNDDSNSTRHLNIPKLTKQFLISPPASPPVGWEPVNEGSPCIDVQLISAIANLVPGKVHEIHAGNESQPGIFVEVCEDAQFGGATEAGRGCPRIPRTMSPGQAVVSRP